MLNNRDFNIDRNNCDYDFFFPIIKQPYDEEQKKRIHAISTISQSRDFALKGMKLMAHVRDHTIFHKTGRE